MRTLGITDAAQRYATMVYRRCGASGLDLPAVSLGWWQNFGDNRPAEVRRDIAVRAFDLGITHMDLANNYGPPYGAAEECFGRILRSDLAPYRDELVVSTKAGWDMWPGPNGIGGSRKYLLASLDASLRRMGLDYVDIFYHHRPDAATPLEETMAALDTAVRSGRALYVGISSYSAADTERAAQLLADLGTPLLIHQPAYSMLNRWVEQDRLLEATQRAGAGVIAFGALSQGLLTSRYLDGIPQGSRATAGTSLPPQWLTDEMRQRLRALNTVAAGRGQTLAQMALAWTLRDARMTSVVVGASSVAQLEENVGALGNLAFDPSELGAIDRLTSADTGPLAPISAQAMPDTDLWRQARTTGARPE